MINVTRWSPDTCKCVIEYSHDTDTGKIEYSNTVSNCPFHQFSNGDKTHFDSVLSENQNKNKAINAIAQAHPEYAKLTDGGQVTPDLEKISYSFDLNRKLIITGTDKSVDSAALQQTLDSALGIGKAEIG